MGLRCQLEGVLPVDALPLVSDHFEVVGDIAILALPGDLEPYQGIIADTLVLHRKNISTVLNKQEKVTGDGRTAHYAVLRGGTSVTVHHEFGFSYRLDIRRSFFTTRMATERKRVTDQVRPGEQVYVPFAGVGPFAIPAAARQAKVLAVEKNPDAFRWLEENIHLNHVEEACRPVLGDAFDSALVSRTGFDRIISPTPYGMDNALRCLLPLVRRGGTVHFYTFKTREEIPGLVGGYEEEGLSVTFHAPCGNVAPGVSRWVFDLVCEV